MGTDFPGESHAWQTQAEVTQELCDTHAIPKIKFNHACQTIPDTRRPRGRQSQKRHPRELITEPMVSRATKNTLQQLAEETSTLDTQLGHDRPNTAKLSGHLNFTKQHTHTHTRTPAPTYKKTPTTQL